MQTAAGFVGIVVKLAARMQGRKNQTLCADALFMHAHGNASSVILNRSGAVRFQIDLYGGTVPCQMLVHGIVHDFINQMVKSLGGNTSYVHTGTFSNCFQAL